MVITSGAITNPCYHSDNGSVTNLIISGGTGPFTYLWSTGNTTDHITGLVAGVYWVKVTDSLGATAQLAFVVGEQVPLAIDFDVSKACPGGKLSGSLTNAVSTTPTYLWNTGETTQEIDVEEGTYTLTISVPSTDLDVPYKTYCTVTQSIQVLSRRKIDIFRFKCCAASLAYKYIRQMEDGQLEKAECSLNKLKMLNGYIGDICDFIPVGTVLIPMVGSYSIFTLSTDTDFTVLNITVDGVVILSASAMFIATTLQGLIDYIIDNIGGGFSASNPSTGVLEITGPTGALNGQTITVAYIGKVTDHFFSQTLEGGIQEVLQTADMNCQDEEDIEEITEKANSLCGCPCDDKDIFDDSLTP